MYLLDKGIVNRKEITVQQDELVNVNTPDTVTADSSDAGDPNPFNSDSSTKVDMPSNSTKSTVHRYHTPSIVDMMEAGTSRDFSSETLHTSPTKILNRISPIQSLPQVKRKRVKQSASHVTCEVFISNKKEKAKRKTEVKTSKTAKRRKDNSSKLRKGDVSESEDDEDTICLICCSPFSQSKPQEEWIQCQECNR